HCHILPGVDDGPATVDEALAVARFAVADGITHVVATPHCHRHIRMLRELVLPHVRQFDEVLADFDVRLTVLPASQIQVWTSLLYRREFEAGVYCSLGDGASFPPFGFPLGVPAFPADVPEVIWWVWRRELSP